jgi:hypothetical protein
MIQPLKYQILVLLASILSCSGFSIISSSATTKIRTPPVISLSPRRNHVGVASYNRQSSSSHSKTTHPIWSSSTSDEDATPDSTDSVNSDDNEEKEDDDSIKTVSISTTEVPAWKRIVFFYKYKNNDGDGDGLTFRQKLAKMGLSALLSYGFVSNMSYCVSVGLAWFGFSKKTGLSPLAPGQWPKFLAVYAGFYVFNNIVRPIRLAISIGVTPYFEKAVATIQRKTGFNKTLSIGIVVFLANICGTTSLMAFSVWIASLAAGVPVFVPKV